MNRLKQYQAFFQRHYAVPMKWTKPVKLAGGSFTGKKISGLSADNRLLIELFTLPVANRITRYKLTVAIFSDTLPRDLARVPALASKGRLARRCKHGAMASQNTRGYGTRGNRHGERVKAEQGTI